MTVAVRAPQILPQQQARVAKWYKQVDEGVKAGELLLELSIDDQLLPISAPQSGVVAKLYVRAGSVVVSNTLLALIKEGLPALSGEDDVVIDPQYHIENDELNAHTQVALKELLAQKANNYAIEVQSLPPQWESSDNAGSAMGQRAGMAEHPAFKDKSYGARQEERRHPSDIKQDQLESAQLKYNLQHQAQASSIPSPSPHR